MTAKRAPAARDGGSTEQLGRLDADPALRERLLPYCRLQAGEIWTDPLRGHRVGRLDATDAAAVAGLMDGERVKLLIADPPYNLALGPTSEALFRQPLAEYLAFARAWVANALACLADDAQLYVWLGADYRNNFIPLPDFMIMMREFPALKPRNFITLRNQRGYGTQRNWMWVRQELLYYVKGEPAFDSSADQTDIPKILRGYYKEVAGRRMENSARGRAANIRAGNVWVDIQQVFYRLRENVPGCYAQKPLKAMERLISAGSGPGDLLVDFFAHSGSGLIAGERLGRRVFTLDRDPVYAEIAIRRLEHYRATGEPGWQWRSPFPEIEQRPRQPD